MAVSSTSMAQALAAYSNAAKRAGSGLEARDSQPKSEFVDFVKRALENAVEVGKQGERQSLAAVSDAADLSEVVTAVSEAELTLETVVAVRDKVIEAYKEILRMPI